MNGEMTNSDLVFIVPPRVGHIIPTIEVVKLITAANPNFSVTVLLMSPPTEKWTRESPDPRIKFVVLQREESSPSSPLEYPSTPIMALFRTVNEHKPHARRIIEEMIGGGSERPKGSRVAGIVVDMFCTTMIDIAREFEIPSYVFITTSAAFLGLMLHMQSLRDDLGVDLGQYEDSDAEIHVPSYKNPVSARVLPRAFFEKGGGSEVFINHAKRFREAKGVVINTFQDLESHAIQALANDPTVPPVYAVGPALNRPDQIQTDGSDVLKWLDLQPDSSVVFLCFGSMGSFSVEQVEEIANALEKGAFRFLWCLRKPPPKVVAGYIPEDYENLENVLPEGFLKRTEEVGRVIGWAPQATVLAHPATGGFVSHCGWNSALESIWGGVPMTTWPMYAEQQVNGFQLVKELGIAVEMKMDSERENVVKANVIQSAIEKLMDSDDMNGVRKKVREMQKRGWCAVGEEGSSTAAMKCFLKNVMNNIPS